MTALLTMARRVAASEVVSTARAQARELARSKRGRALAVLTLTAGALPAIARAVLAGGRDGGRVADASAYVSSLAGTFGVEAARSLSSQPAALVLLAALTLLFGPLVVLAAGFDVTPRDRARRDGAPAIVFGRWLGLWAAVAGTMLAVHVVVWLAVIVGGGRPSAVFASGMRLWFAGALAALPYAGLAVLASVVSTRTSLRLLFGLVMVVVLGLTGAGRVLPGAAAAFILPSAHDAALLVGPPLALLAAAGMLALWAAGSLTLSVGLLRWRTR